MLASSGPLLEVWQPSLLARTQRGPGDLALLSECSPWNWTFI